MIGMVALAVFVLTCSAVGLRLLWIAAHGGGSPAWSCGLGYTFISLVGYPLTVTSGLNAELVGDVNVGLASAGLLFVAAGLSSFYAFTLTTFRRGETWAWGLAIGAISLLALASFAQIGGLRATDPSVPSSQAVAPWNQLTGFLSMGCYLWMGVEGMLEWSRSKKRLALGLSDPVISNRFFLWGVHGLSVTLLNVLLMSLTLLTKQGSMSLAGQVAMASFGLVSASASALAFFPPSSYLAHVRRRAALVTGSA